MDCKCPEDQKRRNYYRYYDTPDGCDIDKKVVVAARYGVIAGLVISTYDILMFSRAMGFMPMLKRYIYHTVPLGLMGATFAVVSNGLLRFREADDRWNYFAAGVACGPILAAYLRSGHGIAAGGFLMGIAGIIKKDTVDSKGVFFPDFKTKMGHVRQWRNDYSLVPDPRDELLHTCQRDK
ncbi:unnamed protein product [Arctia plantaginis]|uniref:NADH dehydrogenase [ubiquinone] 1 alpha subcomplex subunit 11 n=1 Tax=Arctia plantaginis TaxID=874455 RepID=A0A8S1B070_ARCPL|nr:unnamed protein product [Arctia plantaginis]CAB3257911.1 unnamed protein product [Arctia plantaginis]